MTYQIRPMRRDDVPPAFTLIHQVYPCLVVTETLMLERFDRPLTHYRDRHFVAVEGDALVGHIRTRLYPDITGRLQGRAYMTAVASGHHGGALHGDLLQIAERHLLDHGAHVLWAYAAQEEVQVDGEHFRQTVLDRGYERTESTQVLGLALSELPLPRPLPRAPNCAPSPSTRTIPGRSTRSTGSPTVTNRVKVMTLSRPTTNGCARSGTTRWSTRTSVWSS